MDPLARSYPWYTPYQFAGNKPIWAIDLDGLEEYLVTYYFDNSQFAGMSIKILKANAEYVINRLERPFSEFGRLESDDDSNQPHRYAALDPPSNTLKLFEDNYFNWLRNSGGLNRLINGSKVQFNCASAVCFSGTPTPTLPIPQPLPTNIAPLNIPSRTTIITEQPIFADKEVTEQYVDDVFLFNSGGDPSSLFEKSTGGRSALDVVAGTRPDLAITIRGSTDFINRARSYLIDAGVDPSRFTTLPARRVISGEGVAVGSIRTRTRTEQVQVGIMKKMDVD